ncbi:MAG: phosphoribosyltransferase family protein [Patescibacteria group bacterium]
MSEIGQFKNRQEAGKKLAEKLEKYRGEEAVVYALPRGGAVVGAEIAGRLNLPLDLILVRKIGHPFNPEFAIGAVSESGRLVGDVLVPNRVDPEWLGREVGCLKEEISRRRQLYLGGRPSRPAQGKIAIIADDGIATGSTMLAAIEEIRNQRPKKVVVAVPVAPPDTAELMRGRVDEFIAILIPETFFGAVGSYYDEFGQVSDEEVVSIMKNYTGDR